MTQAQLDLFTPTALIMTEDEILKLLRPLYVSIVLLQPKNYQSNFHLVGDPHHVTNKKFSEVDYTRFFLNGSTILVISQ